MTGKRNGNPPQCSCLKNFMNSGAWLAALHGMAESDVSEKLIHTYIINNTLTCSNTI